MVTVSDASEQGAGVCRSMGLTDEGRRRLALAQRQAQLGIPLDHFCLIELFAGIGAGRRAFDLLGLTPGCHLVAEVEESACRVLARAYPDAIQL